MEVQVTTHRIKRCRTMSREPRAYPLKPLEIWDGSPGELADLAAEVRAGTACWRGTAASENRAGDALQTTSTRRSST